VLSEIEQKDFCCVMFMTCNDMPCRYDVIWIQWALLYLTDGENACSMLVPMAAILGVTCDVILFCMDA